MQVVAPVVLNVPALHPQLLNFVDPNGEVVFAGQSMHVLAVVAAMVVEYLPAAQFVQAFEYDDDA